MRVFLFLLLILQILVSSDDSGMVPPEGEVNSGEEIIVGEEMARGGEEEMVGEEETISDDDDEDDDDDEEMLGDDDDGLDEFDVENIDLEDFTEDELAAMVDELYDNEFEPYQDGYGETAVGAEYEDAEVYMDGEEHPVGDNGEEFEYEIAYNPEDWDAAEDEWELDESFDIDISEGDLLTVDYCEHFTDAQDGAVKMNLERCSEVESAFCDCETRPDFYYTPEQCLMLKYQFSFDYLMQDCCLDETVENNLCSDYMEALALCECHPDEGECTEDEMMEDCDYLWDETMHMCRNITTQTNWPICEDEIEDKDDLRTELRL